MGIKRAAEEAPTRDSPIKRTNLRTKIHSISKELVVCNIDLLTQILLRLPASSAIRFKSVCKSWNSLISGRYFCLLWQRHRAPGLLFRALFNGLDSHCCISLLGPDIGGIQFQISLDTVKDVLQSCDGFLLLKGEREWEYWIYNPATLERFTLPEMRHQSMRRSCRRRSYGIRCPLAESRMRILELMEGELPLGPCDLEVLYVNLAFDKSSNGRVVVLTRDSEEDIYHIYVAEFGGAWRHSGLVFEYEDILYDGVYWNNFIVWLGHYGTVCFDVDGEELRVGAAPPGSLNQCFYFEESGGHLHFIQRKDSSTLVVHEMMTDLSAWFVKYSISASQIDPLSSYGFGNGFHHVPLSVKSLVEFDKDSAVLVLRAGFDIISYRIQDQKSTKLCKAGSFGEVSMHLRPFFGYRDACPHIESIRQFHPSSFSNFIS